MKYKIISIIFILLFLISPALAEETRHQPQSKKHKQYILQFSPAPSPQQPQPQLSAVPTQPNNPLPTPDQLYCPLTIYFDDYFDNWYDFMAGNVPAQQLEPHWIINPDTQQWQAFYFPATEDEWNNLDNQWLIIECWWGKYDHFTSFAQIYPPVPPQPGGFYFNQLFSGLGRVVEIGVAPGESYILNEEQFDEFLLQGHTVVYIEQEPDLVME